MHLHYILQRNDPVSYSFCFLKRIDRFKTYIHRLYFTLRT